MIETHATERIRVAVARLAAGLERLGIRGGQEVVVAFSGVIPQRAMPEQYAAGMHARNA